VNFSVSSEAHNRFDDFFADPIYLRFKKDLWNYQVRCRLINTVLARFSGGATLEIGAGVAPMVPPRKGTVFTDVSDAAVSFLKKQYPQCEIQVSSAEKLPFKENVFSQIVCSEVLEHISDDQVALQEMFRVLAPGGSLILTVPVHMYFFHWMIVLWIIRGDIIQGNSRICSPNVVLKIFK